MSESVITEVVNLKRVDESAFDVVRIDRSTEFGNPFVLKEDGGKYSRAESLRQYDEWLRERVEEDVEFREKVESLRGKRLACWCKPSPCHGDVIVEWLNE